MVYWPGPEPTRGRASRFSLVGRLGIGGIETANERLEGSRDMKREISPGAMVVAILVLLGIAVFAFLYFNHIGPFGAGAKATPTGRMESAGTNTAEDLK